MDPIWGVYDLFKKDSNPNKVNLTIGVYKNDLGQSIVSKATQLAEKRILENNLPKDYLAITGNQEFCKSSAQLLFGHDSETISNQNVYYYDFINSWLNLKHVLWKFKTLQTLGGTGALSLGARFLVWIFLKTF